MAHETVDRVKDTANYAEQHARDAAARAADKAYELQDQVRSAAGDGVDKLRAYAEKNPLTCAGIAFAAGLVLSSLIRR